MNAAYQQCDRGLCTVEGDLDWVDKSMVRDAVGVSQVLSHMAAEEYA